VDLDKNKQTNKHQKTKKPKPNQPNKQTKNPQINRKTYRKPEIQSTELNKLKCPSEDASVSLWRERKAITSGEGEKDLGGKEEGEGKGGQDQVWEETGEKYRDRKLNM
jgi:hypothetical protein